VPDSKGRPVFSDFADAAAVEAVLAGAPREWQSKLTTWEYALLQSAGSSAPRPTSTDLFALQRRVVLAHPAMVAYVLCLCAALAGFIGWLFFVEPLSAGGTSPDTLLVAVSFAFPLAGALTQLFQLGRGARAMRLVWAARKRGSEERQAMLREALQLDRRLA
jgi:hypothetical protein